MASNFVKKLDKWCDNQWIVFLCVTATVVAVLAAVFWDVMPLGSNKWNACIRKNRYFRIQY